MAEFHITILAAIEGDQKSDHPPQCLVRLPESSRRSTVPPPDRGKDSQRQRGLATRWRYFRVAGGDQRRPALTWAESECYRSNHSSRFWSLGLAAGFGSNPPSPPSSPRFSHGSIPNPGQGRLYVSESLPRSGGSSRSDGLQSPNRLLGVAILLVEVPVLEQNVLSSSPRKQAGFDHLGYKSAHHRP